MCSNRVTHMFVLIFSPVALRTSAIAAWPDTGSS